MQGSPCLESQRDNKIKPSIWVGVALIAALLGLAGGLGIASTVLDSRDGGLETRLRDTQSQIQDLQAAMEEQEATSQVLLKALDQASQREDALRSQLSQAEAQASSAQEELAQKKAELDNLHLAQSEAQSGLEKLQDLRDQANSIESFRVLLVEMRKDLPQTREEALTHWSRVKSLVARADPSLVSPIDRVILRIDNYFDWDDRSPSPSAPIEEYLAWLADYTSSGAVAYEDAVRGFTKDTLLALINRMDSVVDYLK
ncbi:MAG: hypothetical protein HW388_1199 [Dehalococcoidia bacterium]|nr:hypothetical protein [Dehalococcoidia bacterium]